MNELPRYYTILFNAVEDAVAAMERLFLSRKILQIL